MSKEIIQFDDAMFESKLDRMVREKVEQTINLMLNEEADRMQRRQIREKRRQEGLPGRPLRPPPDRQGRQTEPSGPEAEGRDVPQPGHRTPPPSRGKCQGGADGDVHGRREHQAGR